MQWQSRELTLAEQESKGSSSLELSRRVVKQCELKLSRVAEGELGSPPN